MKEADIELIVQRALEKYPGMHPKIISDNGPQFIARDFKDYIRLAGITHVRTSPYYPQSNGKLERYHKSIKTECIRPKCAETKEEAEQNIKEYVQYYNTERLHSAIALYSTDADARRPPAVHSAATGKQAGRCTGTTQTREIKSM